MLQSLNLYQIFIFIGHDANSTNVMEGITNERMNTRTDEGKSENSYPSAKMPGV